MRPPLRRLPAARPGVLRAGPVPPGAHQLRPIPSSAAPRFAAPIEHSERSSLSFPSGVVLLSVVLETTYRGSLRHLIFQQCRYATSLEAEDPRPEAAAHWTLDRL